MRTDSNDMDEGKAGHYQLVQMTDINRLGGRKLQRPSSKLRLVRLGSWSMLRVSYVSMLVHVK